MQRRRAAEILLGLSLLLPALTLWAQGGESASGDSKSRAESLKPNGPVTVTADRAEWQKGGAMVYSGNVRLASDTMELEGDKVEIHQYPGGEYEAKVTGNPANLRHAGGVAENGQAEPPVSAQGKTLTYDTRTDLVDVTEDATMTRGTDRITGDNIRYNVAERRIQAAGGTRGQVKIVIQPPASKKAAPAKERN